MPLREGDFLLWDQRVVHGSRPNDSERPRIAQFVRAFRRPPTVSARRRQVIEREMRAAGSLELLTPLGRRVFGLDDSGLKDEDAAVDSSPRSPCAAPRATAAEFAAKSGVPAPHLAKNMACLADLIASTPGPPSAPTFCPPTLSSAPPDTSAQQFEQFEQLEREQFERAVAAQPMAAQSMVAPPDDLELDDFKKAFDASMASMLAGA